MKKYLDTSKEVLVENRGKAYFHWVYGIHTASKKFEWEGCTCCQTPQDKVQQARMEAGSSETMLLSPGCVHFDQFQTLGNRSEGSTSKWKRSAREDQPHE